MPGGTNGESLSLTVDERKALAEAWAKAAPPLGLKVYMHIGSESLVDSVELARHAAATKGVSGIVAMTPVYVLFTVPPRRGARSLARVGWLPTLVRASFCDGLPA